MNYQSTKKGKCDFPFFFIFNDLLVIENGSTSLCCGNSELIRVSLEYLPQRFAASQERLKPRTSADRIQTPLVSPDGDILFCILHIPVLHPSGATRACCSRQISQQRQKSNQKNAAPTSLPFGSPHHSTLPTGRPDSPSGLDRTKFDVPVEFSLPKPNASANFTGIKFLPSSSPKPVLSQPKWTASLIGSIDQGRSIESCRAGMRVKTTRWQ